MKLLPWRSSSSSTETDFDTKPSFTERLRYMGDSIPSVLKFPATIIFYILSGIFIVASFFALLVLNLALAAGSFAVTSIIYIVVGHAILRDAHLPGYAFPLHDSARQAAVGGAILAFPLSWVLSILFPSESLDGEEQLQETPLTRIHLHTLVQFGIGSAVGAATGPLGGTVLRQHGWKDMLDNTHAARAGALGGAIMGPGLLVALIVIVVLYKALPVEFGCWRNRSIQWND